MPSKQLFALALAALGAAGCSQQTLNSAGNDAAHDAAVVNGKAQQAARDAKPQLDRLNLQTRVTTALAAANLPTTVHVRADAQAVYLRGTVGSREDKAKAGRIARDTVGPDKAVHNQLQVNGE